MKPVDDDKASAVPEVSEDLIAEREITSEGITSKVTRKKMEVKMSKGSQGYHSSMLCRT